MFTANKYVLVDTIDQAYDLNQNRRNRIVGGMLWLKMSNSSIDTLIDLNKLNLNRIDESSTEFHIGSMVTLRELELHKELNKYFNNVFLEATRHIVGTQFRNTATVGGSVFSKFGFSDITTLLLALDTYVELYKGGTISLKDFMEMKRDNDILIKIIIRKTKTNVHYISQRISSTDFPILACAVSKNEDCWKFSIGARPMKATLVKNNLSNNPTSDEVKAFIDTISSSIEFKSNIRGSKEYRERLAQVLIKRAISHIQGEHNAN